MASRLLSYAEAAEQLHLYLLAHFGQYAAYSSPLTQATAQPITQHVIQIGAGESVLLANAAGRVLAEPLYADRDQPPFARSTRDGYACRAAEANTHQLLFIAGQLRAGQAAVPPLKTGEVCEIMTGAPVPAGADAVFMVEHAEHSSAFVRLAAPRSVAPGENIVPCGSEARAGDQLLPAGTRLHTPQIALAAQCGYAQLRVVPRPRVAILTTGDEVVPVDAAPGPSQIRNSNGPMLATLVAAAGAEPITVPAIPDEAAALDTALNTALDRSQRTDLLLVSGGISAGRFDLVAEALVRRGAQFFFAGVAIQPGKPVAFGQLPTALNRPIPFLALPGNPISSAVTFHLFAAPLLAALGGDTAPRPHFALAKLAEPWRGKAGMTRFLPASCDFASTPAVRAIPWQGSGDLAAYARSNCFLVIAAETSELSAGSTLQILLP